MGESECSDHSWRSPYFAQRLTDQLWRDRMRIRERRKRSQSWRRESGPRNSRRKNYWRKFAGSWRNVESSGSFIMTIILLLYHLPFLINIIILKSSVSFQLIKLRNIDP